MKKLPKLVYVSWKETSDGPWLSTSATPGGEIEDDGPTTVGTYRLVDICALSKRLVSQPQPMKKSR